MTPSDALLLVQLGSPQNHTLWRTPDGEAYVLSPPGEHLRYFLNGFDRLTSLDVLHCQWREAVRDGVEPATMLWLLMEDVERQEAGNR